MHKNFIEDMKVLLYMLAGLAVGVGVGMLFAPSAGSEIRSRLLDTVLGNFGWDAEEEFSYSEMEMDATNGRRYGF
jgi:gas vesicle protein